MIRIILADDHRIFVDGLSGLLERNPQYHVVGRATDGLEAVALAERLKPDVAILDITMPGLNGIEAARKILEALPGTRILALSMHANGAFIAEALKCGVLGYLLKDSAFEELDAAIRSVSQGHAYLSSSISDIVVQDYIRHLERHDASVFSVLSPREREVLQMLSEGLVTKQISARLGVSVKTVETYRKNIMDKLNIHSIAELTKYAIREGITSL
jgi:two-component system, NarL family, response regulator NreC